MKFEYRGGLKIMLRGQLTIAHRRTEDHVQKTVKLKNTNIFVSKDRRKLWQKIFSAN